MEFDSVPAAAAPPDWLQLPRDVTVAILSRVDDFDFVRSAQYVCSSWRSVARDPLRWRTIDMRLLGRRDRLFDFPTMCLRAVDYSAGHVEDITVDGFGSDHLLLSITLRSSQIKCLRLRSCKKVTAEGFCAAVAKLPLLEEVELLRGFYSSTSCIKAVGRYCPRLKSLKFMRQSKENISAIMLPSSDWLLNEDALGIANHLPGLRNLEIVGNGLTDTGVQAILDGCPHLESLDLRCCFNVNMGGDLHRRCKEKLKRLRLPCPVRFADNFSPQSDDDSDENEPYEKDENDDDGYSVSEFTGTYHQSRGNDISESEEDEASESDNDVFSELEANDDEYFDVSDDEFSDVSNNEFSDVSDDEFSEGDEDDFSEGDPGSDSSGPEDSTEDDDQSNDSEYSSDWHDDSPASTNDGI